MKKMRIYIKNIEGEDILKAEMKVKLLSYTNEPEKLVASAAKLCYSPSNIEDLMNDLTTEKIDTFVNKLMNLGHLSPFEHINFTFGISGVSRVLETQFVRHRISSHSIQSGRYVKRDNPDYVYPKEIYNNKEALVIYEKHIEESTKRYNEICDILEKQFIENGMSKLNAEKKASENARYLTPQAVGVQIITTKNLRDLWHYFNERCCMRAQDEHRQLANMMLKECKKVSPLLFKNAGAKCVKGYCPENMYGCGLKPKLNEILKGDK